MWLIKPQSHDSGENILHCDEIYILEGALGISGWSLGAADWAGIFYELLTA